MPPRSKYCLETDLDHGLVNCLDFVPEDDEAPPHDEDIDVIQEQPEEAPQDTAAAAAWYVQDTPPNQNNPANHNHIHNNNNITTTPPRPLSVEIDNVENVDPLAAPPAPAPHVQTLGDGGAAVAIQASSPVSTPTTTTPLSNDPVLRPIFQEPTPHTTMSPRGANTTMNHSDDDSLLEEEDVSIDGDNDDDDENEENQEDVSIDSDNTVENEENPEDDESDQEDWVISRSQAFDEEDTDTNAAEADGPDKKDKESCKRNLLPFLNAPPSSSTFDPMGPSFSFASEPSSPLSGATTTATRTLPVFRWGNQLYYPPQQQQQQHAVVSSWESLTTYDDLERVAYQHYQYCLDDMVQAIYDTQSPRLVCLMLRFLAQHAKSSHQLHWFTIHHHKNHSYDHTTPYATNKSGILKLVASTLTSHRGCDPQDPLWAAHETACQVIRTLSCHQAMDTFLLSPELGLLSALAWIARGGTHDTSTTTTTTTRMTQPWWSGTPQRPNPQVTEQARLHACVTLMNLSCGSSEAKSKVARSTSVMETLKELVVLVKDDNEATNDRTLCLHALTTLKNLSVLTTNDVPLASFPGLLQILGHVLWQATSQFGLLMRRTNTRDTMSEFSSTKDFVAHSACLTLMNLSVSKQYKKEIFITPGVLPALLAILKGFSIPPQSALSPLSTNHGMGHELSTQDGFRPETRLAACTVLSNLAIGYNIKGPLFRYPGLVSQVLHLMTTESGELQSKAGSILWSLAADKRNQKPMVQRQDVVPVLVHVASSTDTPQENENTVSSESKRDNNNDNNKSGHTATYKCVAALALLAESPENALSLIHAGVLVPILASLEDAGPDPLQWKTPTPSWAITCLLNLAQVDAAVPLLCQQGTVVSLLAPLVEIGHSYQSLKAAMAILLTCRSTSLWSEDVMSYTLLRQIETTIPKIVQLLVNTLYRRGGDGYKYGVFTLSSSVACLAALASSGLAFVQEQVCTKTVFLALVQVLWEFAVQGGTTGTIVGGGRDDVVSATWAMQGLSVVVEYLHETGDLPKMMKTSPSALSSLQSIVYCLSMAEQRFAGLWEPMTSPPPGVVAVGTNGPFQRPMVPPPPPPPHVLAVQTKNLLQRSPAFLYGPQSPKGQQQQEEGQGMQW